MKSESKARESGKKMRVAAIGADLQDSSQLRLAVILVGLCFLVSGMVSKLIRPEQPTVAALLALIAALVTSLPVLADAWRGFRASAFGGAKFTLDQFIALSIFACLAAGEFFLAAIVAVILVAGQIIEERSMLGARRAVEGLMRLTRVSTRKITPQGKEEIIHATDLCPGDKIRVLPGDSIAADGIVVAGFSALDQSAITGEALPVEAGEGTEVFAGTTNLSGVLEIQVRKTGDDTVIGHARSIVEEARQTRAPVLRLTEKYASYYTPLVLLLAAGVWLLSGEITRAIAVIIVSIPCALVLAGPTAMVAALASATRLGLLIKSVRHLEETRRVDTVVFDKTGTLTLGRLHVSEFHPARGTTKAHLVQVAAALLVHSRHPVARSICEFAQEKKADGEFYAKGVEITDLDFLREEHGLGLVGTLEGKSVFAGSRRWIESREIAIPASASRDEAGSELHVAVDGKWTGFFLLQDTVRGEAAAIGRRLKSLGVKRLVMLTGDNRRSANRVAVELGFEEVHAGCLPQEKQKIVVELKKDGGCVMVVGDGINDAPALAAGNVSVAMGALGSDIAIQTADMALMSNDLHRLPDLFVLSRDTFRVIAQNLAAGLIFIGLSIVAAGLGWVGPIGAAILHELGAIFVLFNSARLLRYEGIPTKSLPSPPGSSTLGA